VFLLWLKSITRAEKRTFGLLVCVRHSLISFTESHCKRTVSMALCGQTSIEEPMTKLCQPVPCGELLFCNNEQMRLFVGRLHADLRLL
jgi:hypothetical protein